MDYPTHVLRSLRQPDRLYARSDVLSHEDPVPRRSGIYGWYFSGLEQLVPVDGCHGMGGRHLL